MSASFLRSVLLLCLLACLAIAQLPANQQLGTGGSSLPEYKAGQVWSAELDSSITILGVDDTHKQRLIHVRVEAPILACSKIRLTAMVQHVIVTEKVLRKSTTTLAKEPASIDLSGPLGTQQYRNRKVSSKGLTEMIRMTESQPCPIMYSKSWVHPSDTSSLLF